MDIHELLALTHKNKASDLHLSSGQPPMLRINGDIMPLDMPPLPAEDIRQMLHAIMTEAQRGEFEREMEMDFAVSIEGVRFRVNAFTMLHGPGAVMRTINPNVISLDALGAPSVFKRLAELRNGLVLVTGPTGSGKSTTLSAIVDHINVNFPKHIITVEDPIEFVHTSKRALINQREIGKHTHSFARALRSALREDPDVILVGELRDLETIQLALTAAETGHLVFATLHTSSAPDTVDRIIDVFPAESKEMVRAMLSCTLQGVITQTLLKRKTGGRIAAYEIMLGTPAIRNLIREGKIPQITSMMQIGSKIGMCTMKDSINALLSTNLIDQEAATAALATTITADSSEITTAAPPARKSEPIEQPAMTRKQSGLSGEGF